MKMHGWLTICAVCISACSADVRATDGTSIEFRKEGWRAFNWSAGREGYVDRLVTHREQMDDDGLITLRIVDQLGRGIPYARITFVDHYERAREPFRYVATDANGYAYCDMISGSFSVNAQVFSFVPETEAWRFQSRKMEKRYNAQDNPVITVKWSDFPEGTGKVKGCVRDQHGRPLKDFTLSISHRKGPRLTWEESHSIYIKQQVIHPDGHFEVGNLAPRTYTYMVRDADYSAYVCDFEMGQFTIPEEPNSVIKWDIEVEAKELFYGRVVYDDGMPIHRGGFSLWFEMYSYEKRLKFHSRGRSYSNRIDPDGLLRVCLSNQERKDLLECTGGHVEIRDSSGTIGKVHISKLSKSPEAAPTLTFPRKSPRITLVGSRLPRSEDITPDFGPELPNDKAILVCFFDLDQRPSRRFLRQLSARARELEAEDIAVFLIHSSGIAKEKLDNWAKENNVPFSLGMVEGDEERTCFTCGVKSLPWLILTDSRHIVAAEGFGLSELGEKIEQIDGD